MAARPMSQSIPNLINGVSQQPPSLRLASQSAAQVNTFPSVVEGLKKRPPTEFIAEISSSTLGNVYIHTINRDVSERYIVVVSQYNVAVWDIDGNSKTVNFNLREEILQDAKTSVRDGESWAIYMPDSQTTVKCDTTITNTANVKWETSADGTFADAVVVDTVTSTEIGVVISVTRGHKIRARINTIGGSGIVTASVRWKDTGYISSSVPDEAFRCTSIADYTFILNTKKTINFHNSDNSPAGPGGALISVKQGDFDTTYKIKINSTVRATKVTGNSPENVSTSVIAAALETSLIASIGSGGLDTYDITRENYVIHITKKDGTSFKAFVEDGKAGTYMNVATDKVQQFSKLPTTAPDGYIAEVIGDQTSSFDNYFVVFSVNNEGASFDEGTWKETIGPGLDYHFKQFSMPHTLVREDDGTFTYGQGPWEDRLVGDEASAPLPSFVGGKASDIFFHKNRLGLISDDSVILSEAGEFFNFFAKTVTTILDTDVIDVAATASTGDSTGVTVLRHAVGFDKKLLLFADQAQFILEGDPVLTPKTASIDVVTEYQADPLARPVGSGKNIYFATPNGLFSGLREMYVEGETLVKDAADVSAHVPAYLPATPLKLAAIPNGGLVVALCGGDQTKLYPYNFYWSGNNKLQSAWGTWDFGTGNTVLNIDFIDTTLYLLIERSGTVYLESMDMQPKLTDPDQEYLAEELRYLTHVDQRLREEQCDSIVYDSGTDTTAFTLPYAAIGGVSPEKEITPGTFQVIVRAHSTDRNTVGRVLAATWSGIPSNVITVPGDWTHNNDKVYIGRLYESTYKFSEQVVKEAAAGGGETVIGSARINMKMWSVTYATTGYFEVHVNHYHRPVPSVYKFTGRIMGDAANQLGELSLPDGTFKFPVLSKSDQVDVEIKSASFLPMALQNAEWSATVALQFPRSGA